MQWLRLHRNSKAKSHGSCCWHAEEVFPLASLLLSTSFAEAAQAARLWGCPWLLASTCILSPGQEVTQSRRLAKAAPSRTNIFLTLSFHCQESSGVTAQCICVYYLHASGLHLQHVLCSCYSCCTSLSTLPCLLPCLQLWLRQWLLVGGYLLKPSFLFAKPAVFPRHVSWQFPSQQAYIKFATMGFDILCSQRATEWLRILLSLLESRIASFFFFFF